MARLRYTRPRLSRLTSLLALALAVAGVGACTDELPARARPSVTVFRPEPLRRLSHVEYANTLADLLAVDVPALDLPPDTRRSGLENDARALGPSELLLSRYEETARQLAAAAVADDAGLGRILGCASWATPTEIEGCGLSLVRGIGRRALRRPPSSDEEDRYLSLFRTAAMDIDVRGAAELTLSALLMSPAFLYRLEPAPLGGEGASDGPIVVPPYELASRLSYALWQSMPDEALLDAAERGALSLPTDVEREASRMLDDPRTGAMIVDFHRQWLELDRILMPEHAARAGDASWDAAIQLEAHTEALRFVSLALVEGEGTLSALLSSREAEVTERLATLYGVPFTGPPGGTARVMLPEGERAGILTRIAVLASHAHPGYPSPPIRGNYVLDRLTCAPFDAPPRDADLSQPVPVEGEGPRTNRELFAARTASAGCQSCHRRLDGVGFGLESYDARGVFRTIDNGLPVDDRGALVGLDVAPEYEGGVELSARLSESYRVERCYARRWMEMVWGRGLTFEDEAPLARAHRALSGSGGRLDALLLQIVTDEAFLARQAVSE